MNPISNPWFDTLPGPKILKVVESYGEALKARYDTDDVYFAIWLHTLDRAVQRRIGLTILDLEDWGYRDAYDGDVFPKDAAIEMLEDLGYDFENVEVL